MTSNPGHLIRYIRAKRWDDLVKPLRISASIEDSELDELIQLKDSSKLDRTLHPIKGTRFVVYSDTRDIVSVMNGEDKTVEKPKSALRAEAEPFIPARLRAPEAVEDDDEDDPVEPQEDEGDAGIDHTVDLEAITRTVDAARVEHVYKPPTEGEIRAARLISSCYRRLRSRRQAMPKKGLPEARHRWFVSCQEQSQNMDRPYRLVFLGPLPHALVCTEKLGAYAINARKSAHLRLSVAQHGTYEEVKAEVDTAMYTSLILMASSRSFTFSQPHSSGCHRYQEAAAAYVCITPVA